MKSVVAGSVSALIAGALVFVYASRNKEADLARKLGAELARWAEEKAQLNSELERLKRVRGMAGQSAVVTAEPTIAREGARPEEILEILKTLRANSRDPRSIRKVIYHLEQLR